MANAQDPHGDERVETLLSQLRNIFRGLSSNKKSPSPPTDVPLPPPETKPDKFPAPPPAPMAYEPPPPSVSSAPAPAASSSPEPPAAPWVPSPVKDSSSTIFAAVFHPPGKTAEARTLAQKLERLTPKFVKTAFNLSVQILASYDPRGEWKDFILQQIQPAQTKALFMVVERSLDDAKRKALSTDLESKGIYFEQVLIGSIEKKAFYTDVLLGMVFFYDANKPDKTSS